MACTADRASGFLHVLPQAEEDDEMAAFMNDENPDNAVNRFELVEVSDVFLFGL